MNLKEALKTLGFDELPTYEELRNRFKDLVFKNHPDHNNKADNGVFTNLKKAYDILKKAIENKVSNLNRTGAKESKKPIYLPSPVDNKDELNEKIRKILDFLGEQLNNGTELLRDICETGAKIFKNGAKIIAPITIALCSSGIAKTKEEYKKAKETIKMKRVEKQLENNEEKAKLEETQAVKKGGFTEFVPDSLIYIAQKALEAIENGIELEILTVPIFLRNNKEFMLLAVEIDSEVIRLASKALLNDEDFMLKAVEITTYDIVKFAGDNLKNNIDFLIKALLIETRVFEEINQNVKHNKEFIKKAILIDKSIFNYYIDEINILVPEILEDKNIMKQLVKKYGLSIFDYIHSSLLKNEEFIFELCYLYGLDALKYAELNSEEHLIIYKKILEMIKIKKEIEEKENNNIISFEENKGIALKAA